MNTKYIFLMISRHRVCLCVCVRTHVRMWRGGHKEEKKKGSERGRGKREKTVPFLLLQVSRWHGARGKGRVSTDLKPALLRALAKGIKGA